ncbi:hypothetical protein Tco_0723353 [Tanacetum coccineum]
MLPILQIHHVNIRAFSYTHPEHTIKTHLRNYKLKIVEQNTITSVVNEFPQKRPTEEGVAGENMSAATGAVEIARKEFPNVECVHLAQMFGCLARRLDSDKDDMVCVLAWMKMNRKTGSPSIYENGKLNDEKVELIRIHVAKAKKGLRKVLMKGKGFRVVVKKCGIEEGIVYTTTRPNDIKTPYEKMLENDVEFGTPDKRSGWFLNSALVSAFVL